MADGCYIPQYNRASYKGVSFDAMEVSSEHGRRGAEGEFVFGERTGYADLGRKIRKYTVSGRFVRNSHIGDASSLIAACESIGPGILVHPTRGAVRVGCISCRVRDNPLEEQGITYFDLEFVEAGDFGATLFGSLSVGGLKFAGLSISLSAFFNHSYIPSSAKFYNIPSVISAAQKSLVILKSEFLKSVTGTNSSDIWKIASSFDDAINNTKDLKSATILFSNIEAGFKVLENNTAGSEKYNTFKSVANQFIKPSVMLGVAGSSENAITTVMRTLSAVYMAKALENVPPTTLNDALMSSDKVQLIFMEEELIAKQLCDNNLFLALRSFNTESRKMLLATAYGLPSIVNYDLGRGVHALQAAHEIWGDARRVREIEQRSGQYSPWATGPLLQVPNV